jgi:thymidylate synthase
MNSLDKKYIDLLQDILDNGVTKETRNGETLSVFGRQIRHKMSDGFPLLTTKKMAWKTMVTELLWFLRGDTNIKFLVDNNCHIWDGDAYKNYIYNPDYKSENYSDLISSQAGQLVKCQTQEDFINKIKTDDEFAKKWGDLGPVYGKQWRSWVRKTTRYEKIVEPGIYETSIDQIANLINDLKTNPDSRRLMVTAWNPADLEASVLPPCHYGFQVYTRELSWVERYEYMYNTNVKTEDGFRPPLTPEMLEQYNIPTRAISLMWNQRSCDVPLGIPMNIASYGLLLTMIADEVNMIPEELIGNLGDCHIYLDQMDGVKEQINRKPFELPTVYVRDGIHCSSVNDVILENYQSHPKIYFPLSN